MQPTPYSVRWLVNGEEICTWLPADELGVSSCLHTFTHEQYHLENNQDTENYR